MADISRPSARRVVPPTSRVAQQRTGAASLLNGAGAADEELFIKSFEQVPSVTLYSSKELNQELSDILQVLNDTSGDWEKRVEHVKRIRSLLLAGAYDWGLDDFMQRIKDMELALSTCLRDLRSKVVREACVTIAFMCQCLGLRVERFCEGILPVLFQLIPNSAKIMSTSGFVCIRFIIQYTHSPRLIPVICTRLSSKSREIRKACCEFLDQLLHTWPPHALDRHMVTLQKAILVGISDADSEARVFARRAFWGFAEHFKDQADGMIHSLDSHKQKVLLGEASGTLSASTSTNSLFGSSSSSNAPTNGGQRINPAYGRHAVAAAAAGTRPSGRPSVSTSNSVENLNRPWSAMAATRNLTANRSRIPVFSPKESAMDRSVASPFRYGSAIDVGAARRARARAVIASAMAHPNPPPSNFPLSRVGINRRLESAAVAAGAVSSPDRTGRSNGNSRVSQSQPNSRSASPSSWLHRYEQQDRTFRASRKSSIPQATSRDTSPFRPSQPTERVRRISDTVDSRSDVEKRLMSSSLIDRRRSIESEGRQEVTPENKFIPISIGRRDDSSPHSPSVQLSKPNPLSQQSLQAGDSDHLIQMSDSSDHCVNVLRPLIAELSSNQAAIKMFTKLVEQQPESVVSDLLPEMMPALIQAYDSPEIAVRKATVFAMVAIHNSVGEEKMKPYLTSLNSSKMKLLNLYIERSKSETLQQQHQQQNQAMDDETQQHEHRPAAKANGFSSPAH